MAAKAFLIICAQACFMQSVISQCIGRAGIGPVGPAIAAPALAYEGCGAVSSTGGNFAVTSASSIAPTGVSVVSENAIKGPLTIEGNLPLLGSVSVEGAFLTGGTGAVSYGCGDDAVIIVSEGPITTGIVGPDVYAPGFGVMAGPGYGPSIAGYGGIGCGCGVLI